MSGCFPTDPSRPGHSFKKPLLQTHKIITVKVSRDLHVLGLLTPLIPMMNWLLCW